jgi:hypothetical protein
MDKSCKSTEHFFLYGLPAPQDICKDSIYFIRGEDGIEMYITDSQRKVYPINSSNVSQFLLNSPNNSINIQEVGDVTQIEINESYLQSIVDDTVYINTSLVPETIGGYIEGQPITPLEGLTQAQFNTKFFTNITLPTISFNVSNQIIEKGTDFAQTVNVAFNQNDAGDLESYSLEKDGTEVSATQSTAFAANNVIANFTLQGFVSYAANSVLSAGTISTPLRTITQRLKVWYGAVSAIPTNSAQVRAITNDVWDNANTITLQTGTTNNKFVVARPTSSGTEASLQAQDITNNVSYTYDFESTINVVLPNTTTEQYRIYVLEVNNAYTTNAQHLIQI